MAAYFIDLDGTILKFSTNEPIPGAVEALKRIKEAGHQIYITTKRGRDPITGEERKRNTIEALATIGVKYDGILFGVESPRIVVNDRGCGVIEHEQDAVWERDPLACLEGLDPGKP